MKEIGGGIQVSSTQHTVRILIERAELSVLYGI